MAHPPPTLDYIIMLNCHEESRLAELLVDFQQSHPSHELEEARMILEGRLLELLLAGEVGVYQIPDATVTDPSDYQDLTTSQAAAFVRNPANWEWESAADDPSLHMLFSVDEDYWGEASAG